MERIQPTGEKERLGRRRFLRYSAAAALGASAVGAFVLKQRSTVEHAFARRSVPDVLSVRGDVRRLLGENFEVIAGNASVEDSKVLGIGEAHHSFGDAYRMTPAQKEATWRAANDIGALLRLATRDGDHVLMETIDSSVQDFPLPPIAVMERPWLIGIHEKDVTYGGWDDMRTKEDASLPLHEGALLRNERGMIPSIIEQSRKRAGKIIVVSGIGHFTDDPRIDAALEKEGLPYLLLGEKTALSMRRGEA